MNRKIVISLSVFAITHALPAGNLAVSADVNLGQQGLLAHSKGRDEAFLSPASPSLFENVQKAFENVAQPKPLIDTISEEEKYGNTGELHRPLGDAIVNSFEGFSKFLNAAVDLPQQFTKKASKTISSYLSAIGAKLVGL